MPLKYIQFDFQKHCLFCGETCNLEKDPTHTGYLCREFLCKTVGYKSAGKVEIKQKILRAFQTHIDKLIVSRSANTSTWDSK